ncbi:aminoglycoside 6'-N-acetyltransferase [Microvirga rosea]|uniref:aminoglycoside 6'-N-acetyltransferase n=1 Tax=Microvirga rosea TaxID=2715425 RepID=UPI001D0B907F|nr:aminoglycoside 6'-N-acetyltransferase [Microvirga rosea]MCB8820645.1 GNAT family N-acetyltransferase [Microvirga rosea]
MSASDTIRIAPPQSTHLDAWARLRAALWPDGAEEEHRAEVEESLSAVDSVAFLALTGEEPIGFAEVSLRRDYVNGCVSSPVAFLEGIYVDPSHRRRGIAARLVAAAEAWALEQNCQEFASDAELTNTASHDMHKQLGFEETERVVYFRKPLRASKP